jgi:magnesium transporter
MPVPAAAAEAAEAPITFETAAEHASREVPVADAGRRAGDLRRELEGRRWACASLIVVCAGERFEGIVRLEDLLAAPAEVPLSDLMDRDPPVVRPGVDQEIAAWRAVRHAESALAVVDREGRFVGVIPPDRLLAVLLTEHEEDLARLGGFLRSTSAARRASEEPVERRLRHRLPWLLLGLAGALLAAEAVGWFEAVLSRRIVLAFFIPMLVYLADAVGTQTETIVVRGLSVGVATRRMAGREAISGLATGALLALAAGPLVWLLWGAADLALVVALSLLAACATATLVAMALPALLDALNIDPAFASGPLATVIQDLLSILIYLGVATAILR